MNEKYVENPIKEIPEKEEELMQRPEMDFYSKPEGSLNVTVKKNKERLKWQKEKIKTLSNGRNLNVIERDAERLIA